jgi:hypothetical protein
VKLEIEKDLFATGDEVTHDGRADSGEKLLANLVEMDRISEGLHEFASLFFVRHVERDDQTVSSVSHEIRINHFR